MGLLKVLALSWLLSMALAVKEAPVLREDSYVEWLDKWQEVMREVDGDPKLQAEWETRHDVHRQRNQEDGAMPPFDCPALSHPEPSTNVHQLRPNDVSVVAAFGDSITAGNGLGAPTLVHVALENRGESWAVGSEGTWEDGVFTVPNFLKIYNQDIKGGSQCSVTRHHPHSHLNRAKPGGTNRDMPTQAREMIEMVNASTVIDMDKDWKLITLFVGGNDLCGYCKDHGQDRYAPEVYRDNVEEALDILHAGMPRTLVNIVPMFDVSPLTNMSTGLVCNVMHRAFCICAVNETTRQELRGVQLAYYSLVNDVIESGKYDQGDSFTVVMQPHLVDLGPVVDPDTGDWDTSMFAPDCFHLNRKGHQGMAYMLWNVMYMPVGEKPLAYNLLEEPAYVCPTEDYPYIFTNLNSDEPDWKKTTSKRSVRPPVPALFDSPGDWIDAPMEVHADEAPVQQTNHKNARKGAIAAFAACMAFVVAAALLVGVLIPQYKLWKAKKRLASGQGGPASFENPVYFDINES